MRLVQRRSGQSVEGPYYCGDKSDCQYTPAKAPDNPPVVDEKHFPFISGVRSEDVLIPGIDRCEQWAIALSVNFVAFHLLRGGP